MSKPTKPGLPMPADTIVDEPGAAERFQRALQRALNTPPKPRSKPVPKIKEQPTKKGRVHKGKARS